MDVTGTAEGYSPSSVSAATQISFPESCASPREPVASSGGHDVPQSLSSDAVSVESDDVVKEVAKTLASVSVTVNSDTKSSHLANTGDFVITYSHFLPRRQLCGFLMEPLIARVSGSDVLERQVRRVMPNVHVFGHTHTPTDMVLDGIRYVQWPLGGVK